MGWKRVVTAIVLIPLVYSIIRYSNPTFFLLVVAAIVFAGQYEFYKFHYRKFNRFTLLGLFSGFIFLLTYANGISLVTREAVLGLVIFITFSGFLFFRKNLEEAITGVSVVVFGVMYIAWTLGHLISLRALANGQNLIFFVLIVTWGVDTGAYYTGKLFGKHKLSPVISPGKTIEGAIGGIISCVGAAFLARWLFLKGLEVNDTVLIGIVLGIISQIGDLSESLLKRSAGFKDSGSLIPGHGGMLDRVDSLIFTVPAFYYFILYFEPEVISIYL